MKSYVKKAVVLFLCGLFLLLFNACNACENTDSGNTSETTAEKNTSAEETESPAEDNDYDLKGRISTMKTYYVSSSGSDGNSGLSEDSALLTVTKAVSLMSGGDKLCLRCGDTFYGSIMLPDGPDRDHPTEITSYGDGAKPVLSQYKLPYPSAWERVSDFIWRVDLSDPSCFGGNITELDTNAGFLLVDGKVYGHKRFSTEGLEKEWDFFSDNRYCYVKTGGESPAALSDDIRIACNIRSIGFSDNIRVTGIELNGTGGHGISGTVSGAYIGNCDFINIGGSELPGYPKPDTRYGNCIECWSDSSDVLVENCRFTGVYDVAFTMQGQPVYTGWNNIHFRKNVLWDCQQCFEIWSGEYAGDDEEAGKKVGFVNCSFEDNVCINSGNCWSFFVRPDKSVSCHLLIYGLGTPVCDITVRGNTFANARAASIYKSGGPKEIPDDYKIFDNTFIISDGQNICLPGGSSREITDAFDVKIRADNFVVASDNFVNFLFDE
ncbi:MAG: hypothetical protein GX897_10265 [Clostridiales bacterium]|nr:hypothetical protein [Clostridiales bacterium]